MFYGNYISVIKSNLLQVEKKRMESLSLALQLSLCAFFLVTTCKTANLNGFKGWLTHFHLQISLGTPGSHLQLPSSHLHLTVGLQGHDADFPDPKLDTYLVIINSITEPWSATSTIKMNPTLEMYLHLCYRHPSQSYYPFLPGSCSSIAISAPLFTLFMVSFAVQKLVRLIRSHLFIFVFISIALGDWPKKTLVRLMDIHIPFFFFNFFLIFFFYSYFIYLFIYFWLCWVFSSCEGSL